VQPKQDSHSYFAFLFLAPKPLAFSDGLNSRLQLALCPSSSFKFYPQIAYIYHCCFYVLALVLVLVLVLPQVRDHPPSIMIDLLYFQSAIDMTPHRSCGFFSTGHRW
jgi:hypothetical protein